MPDLDAIRREIDGLHAEEERCRFDPLSTSGECVASSDELRRALFAHWPTISQALADAEADRRKARAWDAMRDGAHMRLEEGGWAVRIKGSETWHKRPDLVEALLAGLDSKETT